MPILFIFFGLFSLTPLSTAVFASTFGQALLETFSLVVMTSKARARSAANAVENATLSLNERILRDCNALYVDEERGGYSFLSV